MITVLQTSDGKLLTKTFSRGENGEIVKSAYQNAYRFNAGEMAVTSIDELSEVLTWLEGEPDHCVIRGRIKEGACADDVRRILYDTDGEAAVFEERPEGCPWLLIDFDGVPALPSLPADLRLAYLVDQLPDAFQGVTYHYRWSASAGMDGWQTLSAHLWFYLDAPWRSEIIRERIMVEGWEGVDPSPFDPVHVHYTAAPIFNGVTDPFEGARSGLVRGERDTVALPPFCKPIPPRLPMRLKPKTATGFDAKFDEKLNEIGPNYHIPIREAIYFYVKNAPEIDTFDLKSRVEQAIAQAPHGRSPKSNYNSAYLDRSISGAMRK